MEWGENMIGVRSKRVRLSNDSEVIYSLAVIGSVRTRVVQHPRVVRRLLPGSCAGTARPRRFLPGRRAGTGRSICRNRSAARQEPPAVPAVPAREPPPGAARPGGRCGRNRPAPAGHDGVPKSRIVSFLYHISARCRLVARLAANRLLAFPRPGAGLSPCARNTIREAISRDTSSSQHAGHAVRRNRTRNAAGTFSGHCQRSRRICEQKCGWPSLSDDEELVQRRAVTGSSTSSS